MYHNRAIENSPLQAYASALLFSPKLSLIKRQFQHEEPKWINIKPAIGDSWSACPQTLEGHSGDVNSVAFSHDSTRLASASDDRTVKIWDAGSGECLQTLESHSGWVLTVAFSHDSTRLASASNDCTVKIWNAGSGECLQTLHIGKTLSHISFDITNSYLHTELGAITINSPSSSRLLLNSSEPQSPQYQRQGLSAGGMWITYRSENLVWMPSEYRPSTSVVSGKMIGIGVATGKVWICNIQYNDTPQGV
jgi:WD40 repeat protein